MGANLKSYRDVLKSPGALRLILSAYPARTAYGMISLSIYFKVQQSTGSIAIAGLATGLNGLAGAITAGIRGAVIDRFGMIWPLRILVPSYAFMIVVLSFGEGRSELIFLATLLGLTGPPINLSVRPLWKLTVSPEKIRTAYALDTAFMNSSAVIAPLIATTISLSISPNVALRTCASLMLLGGILLLLTWQVGSWEPEKKEAKTPPIWRVKGIQLLAIEGVAIGLGWGAFDIGVPAFGTLEGVPERVGFFFALMATFNVIGGLVAGTISRKISPLRAFRTNYLIWALVSLPLAFTHMDYTLALVTIFLAFFGGVQQVFYWEITEAVRPKGAAVQTLGWLWTIEGSAAAAGTAIGGYVAEHLSPRYCLAATTVALFIGYLIITKGQNHLSEADRIPTEEEDTAAMENTADTTH
jgi:predicted MFS family arabinose efflux permease